ncbi:IS1096 element passenger TnpR family protein [Sinomicrobium sp.]
MIYKFRIILDAEEDVFRDIEIEAEETMEVFHNTITQAFGFEGSEMASFYLSDETWNQGEEIALFEMSDEQEADVRLMAETSIDDVLDQENTRAIYVYDFLSMWTFFVELADIAEKEDGRSYPNLLFAHGQLPEAPPEKQFETEEDMSNNDFNDFGLDIDDYDDLDFDENWN